MLTTTGVAKRNGYDRTKCGVVIVETLHGVASTRERVFTAFSGFDTEQNAVFGAGDSTAIGPVKSAGLRGKPFVFSTFFFS